jgi:excisionase family DNA binding protein
VSRLLRARDVADMLGFSAATIVDWAEQGRIPHFKVGRAPRFRESEIEAWLEERHIASRDVQGVSCGRRDRVA